MLSELKALCDEMSKDLVPRTSKHKYNREWKRFQCFLKDHDVSIADEQTIKAYLMKESKEFAPTTVRHKCSILNEMTVAEGEPQPDVL